MHMHRTLYTQKATRYRRDIECNLEPEAHKYTHTQHSSTLYTMCFSVLTIGFRAKVNCAETTTCVTRALQPLDCLSSRVVRADQTWDEFERITASKQNPVFRGATNWKWLNSGVFNEWICSVKTETSHRMHSQGKCLRVQRVWWRAGEIGNVGNRHRLPPNKLRWHAKLIKCLILHASRSAGKLEDYNKKDFISILDFLS